MKLWVYSGTAALALGAVLYFHGVGVDNAALTPDPARATESAENQPAANPISASAPRGAKPAKAARGKRAPRPASRVDRQADGGDSMAAEVELEKGRALFGDRRVDIPRRAASPERQAAREKRRGQASTMNPRVERRLQALRAELAAAAPSERRALERDIEALERNVNGRRRRAAGAAGAPQRSRSGG